MNPTRNLGSQPTDSFLSNEMLFFVPSILFLNYEDRLALIGCENALKKILKRFYSNVIIIVTERYRLQFSLVQLLRRVRLFVTPWIAAHQASLSIANSQSLPKSMSIESVMPCNHLILCCPLLLLPSIFPSIRVFSSESALRIRCPKYWSFSFIISPTNEHPGLISLRMDWLDLLAVQGTLRL